MQKNSFHKNLDTPSRTVNVLTNVYNKTNHSDLVGSIHSFFTRPEILYCYSALANVYKYDRI